MKTLHLLLLLWLPLAAAAQNEATPTPKKEPYAPGNWYLGVKWEDIALGASSYVVTGRSIGLVGGYALRPRLAVQAGLTPTNVRQLGRRVPRTLPPLSAPFDSYTGNMYTETAQTGLYVPLVLRYSFLPPAWRFQPYVQAGVHGYLAASRRYTFRYENGAYSGQYTEYSRRVTTASGLLAGLGIRLRLVDRFSLYGDLLVGRTLQTSNLATPFMSRDGWPSELYDHFQMQYTAQTALGVLYELK
jgi:hypothetical protein